MPHVNNNHLSNYQGMLGQQVLMTSENVKSLILQPLSEDLLSDSFPHLLLYRTGYIIYHYRLLGFLTRRLHFFKQGGSKMFK